MLLLSACITAPSLETRVGQALALAEKYDWKRLELDSTPYSLQAFVPQQGFSTDTLTIYIEGDGLAWISRRRVSKNPTPSNPIAFELALLDPNPSVYLARPCQYVLHTDCDQDLWTSARFADAVIDSSNNAIDQLKRRFAASKLRLVGYSGGAAIAALVASRRNDVMQLVTVAGNLDHQAWTERHRITPLYQSLNPADYWHSLTAIPQLHFIGEKDRNIGPFVSEAYLNRFPPDQKPAVHIVRDADHYCCWAQNWPALLQLVYNRQ
jgi:pimeloyl-ACP methyl ester carboxylesterase